MSVQTIAKIPSRKSTKPPKLICQLLSCKSKCRNYKDEETVIWLIQESALRNIDKVVKFVHKMKYRDIENILQRMVSKILDMEDSDSGALSLIWGIILRLFDYCWRNLKCGICINTAAIMAITIFREAFYQIKNHDDPKVSVQSTRLLNLYIDDEYSVLVKIPVELYAIPIASLVSIRSDSDEFSPIIIDWIMKSEDDAQYCLRIALSYLDIETELREELFEFIRVSLTHENYEADEIEKILKGE